MSAKLNAVSGDTPRLLACGADMGGIAISVCRKKTNDLRKSAWQAGGRTD
jgi:hypothetical protein